MNSVEDKLKRCQIDGIINGQHWRIQDFTKGGGGGTGKQFMIICITKALYCMLDFCVISYSFRGRPI